MIKVGRDLIQVDEINQLLVCTQILDEKDLVWWSLDGKSRCMLILL
jgi:hypothetical protein